MENKIEFKHSDHVLVRDKDNERWWAAIYDQYLPCKGDYPHQIVGGRLFAQCIPYKGNERLLGTANRPVPKPESKPWKPKLEETFFTIRHHYGLPFYVSELKWECEPTDEATYRLGNCFRTREEAQEVADKFNAILKGKE